MKKIIKIFPIIFLTLAVIPLFCQAFSFEEFFNELEGWFSGKNNEAQIINEVNVSANTGNNVVNGNGEISEGENKSSIYVKNIINGKEIEPIEIETEANEVSVESEIKVENGKAIVQRETQIDSDRSTENYEVDLENAENNKNLEGETSNEILDEIQEWWTNFIEDLKSFFRGIFNF